VNNKLDPRWEELHAAIRAAVQGHDRQVADDLIRLYRRRLRLKKPDPRYIESSVRAIARRTGLTCSEVRESAERLQMAVAAGRTYTTGLMMTSLHPRDHRASVFVLGSCLTEAL
jgi:hypothetical protein